MSSKIKWTSFIFFMIVFMSCTKEETKPIDCNPTSIHDLPEDIATYINSDFRILILNHIYGDSMSIYHTYKDSLFLPDELENDIFGRFGQIYCMTDSPERDTVLDSLRIHARGYLSSNRFSIYINKDELWQQNFYNEIIPTGNSFIDSLYTTLEFEIIDKREFSFTLQRYWIEIEANIEDNMNIIHLGEVLANHDDISLSSGLNTTDGNEMFLEIDDENNFIFTFKRGWGDCPSGCIHKRYWEFKVTENCEAEFVRSYGSFL